MSKPNPMRVRVSCPDCGWLLLAAISLLAGAVIGGAGAHLLVKCGDFGWAIIK